MEQSLRKVSQESELALWGNRIRECRESGEKFSHWCSEHEISVSTYYKWQRKLFAMAQKQAAFVEVTPLAQSSEGIAVTIHLSGVEADIHNGAEEETVAMVFRLLKSC